MQPVKFNPIFDEIRPQIRSLVETHLKANILKKYTYDESYTNVVIENIERVFLRIITYARGAPVRQNKFSEEYMTVLHGSSIPVFGAVGELLRFTISVSEKPKENETPDCIFGDFTSDLSKMRNAAYIFDITWKPGNKYIYPSTTVSRPAYCPEDLAKDELTLLRTGRCSDMTIKVGGETIPVHKFKLVTRSTVLESMFEKTTSDCVANTWVLEGVSPHIVQLFLEFLYSGRIEFQTKHSIVASGASAEAKEIVHSFKDLINLNTFAAQYKVESLDACIMYWIEKFAQDDKISKEDFVKFFGTIFPQDEQMTVLLMQLVMLYEDRYLKPFFSCLTLENVDAVLEIATRHKLQKICTEISNYKKYHLELLSE